MSEYETRSRTSTDPDYNPNQLILCATLARSDAGGGYVMPVAEVLANLESEVMGGDWPEPGDSITLTFGVHTQRELDAMPEFGGW